MTLEISYPAHVAVGKLHPVVAFTQSRDVALKVVPFRLFIVLSSKIQCLKSPKFQDLKGIKMKFSGGTMKFSGTPVRFPGHFMRCSGCYCEASGENVACPRVGSQASSAELVRQVGEKRRNLPPAGDLLRKPLRRLCPVSPVVPWVSSRFTGDRSAAWLTLPTMKSSGK
jgi:hypothetical protein